MNLSVSVSLLAVLVSGFAVLAIGAVYARLRKLEHTALNPSSARLEDLARQVPPALWPGPGQSHSLILLMDGTCSTCHTLWEAAPDLAGIRVIGLLPDERTASRFGGGTTLADPDLWRNLYEGYTPCVYVVDTAGTVADRRYVYGDTDVPALLAEVLRLPVTAAQGGTRVH
ncbi:hypothetical protein [Streptosporangium sp. KLBMP 9127]|nr:hypothetical protein [Streptosporangium sp. KLBMP 9127]